MQSISCGDPLTLNFQLGILDDICEEEIALEMLSNIHRQSEEEFFAHQSGYVKRRAAIESVNITVDAALRFSFKLYSQSIAHTLAMSLMRGPPGRVFE